MKILILLDSPQYISVVFYLSLFLSLVSYPALFRQLLPLSFMMRRVSTMWKMLVVAICLIQTSRDGQWKVLPFHFKIAQGHKSCFYYALSSIVYTPFVCMLDSKLGFTDFHPQVRIFPRLAIQ